MDKKNGNVELIDQNRKDNAPDPLEAALKTVNHNMELHKGPEAELLRKVNATDEEEMGDKDISADDSGE